MKTLPTLALVSAALVWIAAATGAVAHEFTQGDLMVDHPWARPNIPNRPTAAYAEIMNAGTEADRLIAASSPAFGRIELHTTTREGDVMKMERVEGIEVPAGGSASLEPGGLHIMLFDAVEILKEGASFPLTLTFENAGEVVVVVNVEKRGPTADQDDHGGHGDHSHGDHSHGTTN
ncbi:MAG: copper chaperone PCu(A)C [Pseudomonadota bacterium]